MPDPAANRDPADRPKHTDGPWDYNEDMDHIEAQGAPLASVNTPDDFPCLDPEEHDMDALWAEYRANGYLMAAAPIGHELASLIVFQNSRGHEFPLSVLVLAMEFLEKASPS